MTSRLRRVGPGQVHAATLVIGFVVLLLLTRNQWFFFDEWDFVTQRLMPGGSLDPLRPHVGQLVTMPVIAYKLLFGMFALRTYTPYIGVVLIAHIGLTHVIWRVMRRGGVDPWIATGLGVVFLLFGAGYEGIVWATQMGLDSALLLGVIQVLLVDHEGGLDRRDGLACVAGVLAVLFLGAGVIMAVIAGGVALMRRGVRAAALTTLVPVGFYAIWFLAYGHRFRGTPVSGPADLLHLPDYVWIGLTHTAEGLSGLTQAGSLLVVALFVWLFLRRRLALTGAGPALFMAAGAPLAFAVIGVARVGTGIDQAASSRYLYTGAALMLPAAGLVLTEICRRSRTALAAMMAALVLVAVHGSAELVRAAGALAGQKQESKARVLAAARLAVSGEIVIGTSPDPAAAPQLSFRTVAALERAGDLPPIPEIGAPLRLAVAAQLQLDVTDSPALPAAEVPATVHPIAVLGSASTDAGGCLVIDADGAGVAISVSPAGPGSLALTPSTTGALGVLLADLGDPEHTSPQRTFGVAAFHTVYLDLAVRQGQALLALPRGRNRICGAALDAPPR